MTHMWWAWVLGMLQHRPQGQGSICITQQVMLMGGCLHSCLSRQCCLDGGSARVGSCESWGTQEQKLFWAHIRMEERSRAVGRERDKTLQWGFEPWLKRNPS